MLIDNKGLGFLYFCGFKGCDGVGAYEDKSLRRSTGTIRATAVTQDREQGML